MTVIGVIKDVKEDLFNYRINRSVWYVPYAQSENNFPLNLVLRMSGDPASATAAIREVVHEIDPDQPISNVMTDERKSQRRSRDRTFRRHLDELAGRVRSVARRARALRGDGVFGFATNGRDWFAGRDWSTAHARAQTHPRSGAEAHIVGHCDRLNRRLVSYAVAREFAIRR